MGSRIASPDTDADVRIRQLIDASPPQSFIVKAGAGSGKTTSLIKSLDHINKTHGATLRRNGQKIACITYTEVAANEVKEDIGESPLLLVSTIHSFLWTVIKPFQRDLKRWLEKSLAEKIQTLEYKESRARKEVTRARYARRLLRAKNDLLSLPNVNHFTYQGGSRYSKGILGHHDIISAGPTLILEHELLAKIVSRRFPFILVDESQDTFKSVVDALTYIDAVAPADFSLSFFGDPAQMIYTTGVGAIPPQENWTSVEKPQNFRCPTKVLSVINTIRGGIDSLVQIGGRQSLNEHGVLATEEGSVDIFLLPAETDKTASLDTVRRWLARRYDDTNWSDDQVGPDKLQILVIEHRLAAERLGFGNLFDAFTTAPPGLEIDFREGRAWPLQIFRSFIIPLHEAMQAKADHSTISLLRHEQPELFKLSTTDGAAAVAKLRTIKTNATQLANLFAEDKTTVRDVLLKVREYNFATVDERLDAALDDPHDEPVDDDQEESYLSKFLSVPVSELGEYHRYVDKLSPYSTHQGVKGEEFPRVLVVLDDEGSNYNLFSYDKLFGLADLSDTDQANIHAGTDSVVDRTRRLLYVCCSRSTQALAVAIYTGDLPDALQKLRVTDGLGKIPIRTLQDLG